MPWWWEVYRPRFFGYRQSQRGLCGEVSRIKCGVKVGTWSLSFVTPWRFEAYP